ncbi:hypothetical protein SY27_07535 [Flavobacterium sp. 316]|nr:hypothetical protein SY27_07535 [Flavobacterium sp. 316]
MIEMKTNTFILILFIWIVLLLSSFLVKKEKKKHVTILKTNGFIIIGDKVFYSVTLINIFFILFYIIFGYTELDFKYFILHLLIFIISTMKFKPNYSKSSNFE